MIEERWEEPKEKIEKLIDLIKGAPLDQIDLLPTEKNKSFMQEYNMTDERWKKILKTITYDEYDESMWNKESEVPRVLHVFFIERLLANAFCMKEECKLYIKLGIYEIDNVFVVSFHKPDYPLDYRFERL